ncbi:hypothetical protein FIV41_25795 [Pseudomonas marginalis]|uniref:Uncharacterized protein n=1 Tax=Pseudomonas marginalis TaxID=298 RepID=A0A9X9FVC6_PSEMA|nr:hypothetical protein [Pseudomonas marginalis]TWR52504.1 hypothetical protein FIV41_25795 [Pseudomonas marginalis]SEC53872.1 hypothetical protein SAMN04490193_2992 [Pseudomonas marginalis]
MSPHPWKHSVVDVYANNYGNVVQDYLELVVRPSLQALQCRRDELIARPDIDDFIKSLQALDHYVLEQGTAMAFCLGIQSLWEQQIRTYMSGCARQFVTLGVPNDQAPDTIGKAIEKAEKALWGAEFNELFLRVRGLELPQFQSYPQLDLLMLLGNVCRHGEGKAARALRKRSPELWPASSHLLEEHYGVRPVTDLMLSFELLRSLVHAVVLFWRDLERQGLFTIMDREIVEARLSNRVREY